MEQDVTQLGSRTNDGVHSEEQGKIVYMEKKTQS